MGRDFLFSTHVQISPRNHPGFKGRGRVPFPTAKRTECGADHPHLSSVDVKEYLYTPSVPA
jgi:hypothetical protein